MKMQRTDMKGKKNFFWVRLISGVVPEICKVSERFFSIFFFFGRLMFRVVSEKMQSK